MKIKEKKIKRRFNEDEREAERMFPNLNKQLRRIRTEGRDESER